MSEGDKKSSRPDAEIPKQQKDKDKVGQAVPVEIGRPPLFTPFLMDTVGRLQKEIADQMSQNQFCQFNHESRSEEHTSELQSRGHLVCRLLLEKKKISFRKNHNQLKK